MQIINTTKPNYRKSKEEIDKIKKFNEKRDRKNKSLIDRAHRLMEYSAEKKKDPVA